MDNGIRNNMMAVRTINRLNKNLRTKENAARHLSLGELISSAGDDASAYSIGEKMKVRIRALDQDHNNVQNGAAMLHVAEGGIQRQIDILCEIKAKAIDAANDTNTESDRKTIQKEIDQGWQQIEAIADETEYNGIKVLHGIDKLETIKSWNYLSTADLLPYSDDMGIVPNVYDTLDGKIGPFDVFTDYGISDSSSTVLGLSTVNPYTKTSGTPNTWDIDFSAFTNPSKLEGCSFTVPGQGGQSRFVFTANPQDTVRWPASVIDIRGCTTMDDVLDRMVSKSSLGDFWGSYPVERNGNQIRITAFVTGKSYNSYEPKGYAQSAMTVDPAATATGMISGTVYLTGGANAVGSHGGEKDAGYQPATAASLVLSSFYPASGSGVTLHLKDDSPRFIDKTHEDKRGVFIKFVDGTSAPQWDESNTYMTVGKDAVVTDAYVKYANIYMSYSQGALQFRATPGAWGNDIYLTDGVTDGTVQYHALTSLMDAGATVTNRKTGTDASLQYDLDLTKYNTTDPAVLETFIQDLTGKSLIFHDWLHYGIYLFVNFFDSSKLPTMDGVPGMSSTNYADITIGGKKLEDPYMKMLDPNLEKYSDVDLNDLRTKVLTDGQSIANAFANLVGQKNYFETATEKIDANGDVSDLVFIDICDMPARELPNLYVVKPTLRHYDLDYDTWFQNHTDKLANGVAAYLDGKGFRAYCASDNAEWFNFAFHNGAAEDRPTNNLSAETIRTIDIDVSDVADASSLVKAIYDQAEPQLQQRNHYMHLAADESQAVLTLYDDRGYALTLKDWPELQEKGAKIADGCYYNPLEGFRYTHGKNFIIQHTDKADFNIRLTIPRTTMNEIFGYDPAVLHPEDFNVLTEENRELLLGKQGENGKSDVQGKLDEGLEYLLSAITLVGAQTKRLEYADANIITDQENTTASESTIRDADMAKEMTQYTKANVLAQAAQSMLAQANQQNENMLGLLP